MEKCEEENLQSCEIAERAGRLAIALRNIGKKYGFCPGMIGMVAIGLATMAFSDIEFEQYKETLSELATTFHAKAHATAAKGAVPNGPTV